MTVPWLDDNNRIAIYNQYILVNTYLIYHIDDTKAHAICSWAHILFVDTFHILNTNENTGQWILITFI